ncbi:PIN domain-containing protein [Pseudomonas viridiflava]|uniref:PIN domain-containing protein n=1 Tax=Pseudomonas viridiflava TaxID=33069 RepID=UPI000F031827|nr:PIN domain-containing protein [Pseudomonas viridiflava]
MAKIIVLDTSYMLELFAVPLDSTPERSEEARRIFEDAVRSGFDIFCPLSVLYELANHIVDIKNHTLQRTIAERFKEMVEGAFSADIPFSIIPNGSSTPIHEELASLPDLCRNYQENIRMGLGLTDCTIIDVAKTLKINYVSRKKNWPTHIWTTHAALKSLAPDDFGHEYF